MKKTAMLNSVKDSFILLILCVIAFGIYAIVLSSYGKETGQMVVFISMIIVIIIANNIFAALGASMLYNTPYDSNKEKYSIRIAVFNEDKKSSTLQLIKVMFHSLIGMVFYPFAGIALLLNIKELFVKDEVYENIVKEENLKNQINDELDIKIKSNKKWKISTSAFSNYYFYTEKEAYKYASKHNIRPEKITQII